MEHVDQQMRVRHFWAMADSTPLYLHHYDRSPYSEKIRRILAYKKLAYSQVAQPEIMPKPEQTLLTGGYRKAPVLQIGADVYCDTALIADVLEERAGPSLYPPKLAGLTRWTAAGIDSLLFQIAAVLVFQPQGSKAPPAGYNRKELFALLKDRTKMMRDAAVIKVPAKLAHSYLQYYLDPMESQLEQTAFLCGDDISLADFTLYATWWFLSRNGNTEGLLKDYKALNAWAARVYAASPEPPDGRPQVSRAEALQVAAVTEPASLNGLAVDGPGGGDALKGQVGSMVSVAATDYGREDVTGILVGVGANELVVRHENPEVGVVHTHFPLYGYELKPAEVQ